MLDVLETVASITCVLRLVYFSLVVFLNNVRDLFCVKKSLCDLSRCFCDNYDIFFSTYPVNDMYSMLVEGCTNNAAAGTCARIILCCNMWCTDTMLHTYLFVFSFLQSLPSQPIRAWCPGSLQCLPEPPGGLSPTVGHPAPSLPSPWTLQQESSCPTLPPQPPLLLHLLLVLLPSGPHRPTWPPSQPSPSMRGGGRSQGPWMWPRSLFILLHLRTSGTWDNNTATMCQL